MTSPRRRSNGAHRPAAGGRRPASLVLLRRGGQVGVAVGVVALVLLGRAHTLPELPLAEDLALPGHPTPAGWALLLAGPAALVLRKAAPLSVLGVNLGTSLGYVALGNRPPALPLGGTGRAVHRRRPLPGAGLGRRPAGRRGRLVGRRRPVGDARSRATCTTPTWSPGWPRSPPGYGLQLSRLHVTMAAQQSEQLARDRAAAVQQALDRQRSRIAGEVHDLVAHDVAVIVAQAATAQRVQARSPDVPAAVATLAAIEEAARDAMDGLRRVVGLVRSPAAGQDLAPAPGLDRLPDLVAQVERAGLPVSLQVSGPVRRLPATVELHVYRIVQEALTNTLKHAGPSAARVDLAYGTDALELTVDDDGLGPAPVRPAVGGQGLLGMRERAEVLGGQVRAGPPRAAASAWRPGSRWPRRRREHDRPHRRRPADDASRAADLPRR